MLFHSNQGYLQEVTLEELEWNPASTEPTEMLLLTSLGPRYLQRTTIIQQYD